MSLFSSFLSKLGIGGAEAAQPATTKATSSASVVDVVPKLEGLAASHVEALNWKTSIVDLLKVLGLDCSLTARKELATDLGCPADKMGDSAQMNIWLHKTVQQKLTGNGVNIQQELPD
jgi:hypothetical protein